MQIDGVGPLHGRGEHGNGQFFAVRSGFGGELEMPWKQSPALRIGNVGVSRHRAFHVGRELDDQPPIEHGGERFHDQDAND